MAEALKKADKVIRPYAIFCNPKDKETIYAELKDKFVIKEHPAIEQGTMYVVDREQFENWTMKGDTK